MGSDWTTAGLSMPMAIVIVGLLFSFVALAAVDTGVAVIVAIFAFVFGGDIFREMIAAIQQPSADPANEETAPDEDPQDALERLRTRYADGDLSDSEFERRLEVLLETETVDDVERYLAGESESVQPSGQPSADSRDREFERSMG
ncbi:DUF1707 domain-containing protein [Natronolimnobius sp. AArcel1]|uniref:SHOCT domain-containing protein n=1 Tax=Natronolimnobius sp. AArcel1 TaxID=1679093 RepID=UPI0013ECE8D9|nr:SHOCT domain-containing protein [Natronolimnobius sp. AArcel1]NGM68452.1 DUF1707 domain-containing protein [Natronolimnobius sp. AArcel1]